MNRKLDIAMVAAVSLLAGLLLGLWAASRADDGAAEPIDNDAAGLLARAAVDEFVPSEPAGGASRRDESGRSGGGTAAPHTADAAEPSTAAPPTGADGRGPSSPAARRARSNLSPLTCRFRVTAYEPSARSCGRWTRAPMATRRTAGGYRLAELIRTRTKFCAAPPEIPFGTVIDVPGYGAAIVADRGGAIGPGRLDVFFPTVAQAVAWGVRDLDCEIRPAEPLVAAAGQSKGD